MIRGLAGPLVLACLVSACDESAPAPAPSPLPSTPAPAPAPPPAPSPVDLIPTVSGVVVEHTVAGPRPLAGLRFLVVWFPHTSPWDYLDSGPGTTQVTSDDSGRYVVAAAPGATQVVISLAEGTGFHVPCPPGFDALPENATMDVHVVSNATLASTGAPGSLPTTPLKVRGTVLQDKEAGGRPIGGASVTLAADGGWLVSYTLTDAAGRFLLCTNPPGSGTGQSMLLHANKDGYRGSSRSVVIRGDDRVSLELERN